jgi:DNA-binding Lrp family transcriptional regulator
MSIKSIELKLIAELLKNSRRSDRELAKAVKISQPTVTRARTRLEKAGLIKEYTIVPDFGKLGYHLCSMTFAKFTELPHVEALRKAIETYGHRLLEIPQAVLIERGMGMGANGVVIALHKDYTAYMDFTKWLRQFSLISPFELSTFLINLDDQVHYRYLTFSTLAKHVFSLQKAEEKE